MKSNDIINRINEIENEINKLPKGSICKKNIKNKTYYYNRFNENGKRKEKYIDISKLEDFKELLETRKNLQIELNMLNELVNINNKPKKKIIQYNANILTGELLKKFILPVKNYKKRECFKELKDYIYGKFLDKVFILYGLRRTGKTTLIRQMIASLSKEKFEKTAFIQISINDTLSSLNKDLKKLQMEGYKYIFIDEVTLLDEFIEGAALFSDIYASIGLKIVLSGTDSLGFMITKNEQLYDRCILLHTTFIPYREFKNVLGINGIDEYIRYGGTMSLGGINYNQNYIFYNEKTTNEYIDTSIAKNIQHSLKYYDNGNHFRNLQELYENNELTNVINRVVEDINHRFTKEVLIRDFKSNDLSLSAKNLRMDKNNPITILDEINKDEFHKNLKKILEVLDAYEQKIELTEIHALEIKEYLRLLDLIFEVEIRTIPSLNNTKKNIIISQPGIRYSQAIALINSLLLDEKFFELSLKDKDYIISRITSEIKGRMMEDIILLETKIFNPEKEVFKLQFAIGEFDMVVFDPFTSSCEIYEIKHSREAHYNQYQYLIDNEKLKQTKLKYGDITRKCVIYNGESHIENDIEYINVEKYLMFN